MAGMADKTDAPAASDEAWEDAARDGWQSFREEWVAEHSVRPSTLQKEAFLAGYKYHDYQTYESPEKYMIGAGTLTTWSAAKTR
jgi:hypothetical protein